MPPRARAHLLVLLLATPAFAQTAPKPQVSVALDPDGPVTVGTPVQVSVTLLVPTYMPRPPVWPDLQIADAVTRLPERATHPVTQRIGQQSWSGITRTWKIIPQRPADYDLGTAQTMITYADPDTNAPLEATLDLPPIAFTATVPPGAEGIDPFLAAASLTVTASLDGLPDAPEPGDAFTLTLDTTASGPPAMLLPPLADRLPDLPGLRAYPRQPKLTDQPGDPPTATRTEAIAYVVEAPGTFTFPAISLEWWNSATQTRETAASDSVTVNVAAPNGWRAPDDRGIRPSAWAFLTLAAVAALAAVALVLHRRPRAPRLSPRTLHRALRTAVRSAPAWQIRLRLAAWKAALPDPPTPATSAGIETALHELERHAYGASVPAGSDRAARRALLSQIDAAPPMSPVPTETLPGLNP